MRCTQFFGLTKWAREFLYGRHVLLYTERVTKVYPDGRLEAQPDRPILGPIVEREPSGEHYYGLFADEEEYDLHRYTFPNGMVCYEEVQIQRDSSGPMIFLALKVQLPDGQRVWIKRSKWTKRDLRQYV